MEYSIAIPVYNEEMLLESAVQQLCSKLKELGWSYELLLAENGSTDRTRQIVEDLEKRLPQVRAIHSGAPNYGLALKGAIEAARGTYMICDEIDICDTDFYERAIALLESGKAEIVVGSKRHPDSRDERPWLRCLATAILNLLFNVLLEFDGTDTHGLKAFHRTRLLPVLKECVLDKDLLISEFVIRAQRANYKYLEIPVHLKEKRRSSIHLFRRVPNVLKGLLRLILVIRLNRKP